MAEYGIDPILRLPEVERVTGYRRSHIYALEAKGLFPARLALGTRSVGWTQSSVRGWIEARQPKVAA